jgi:hypothetical protein
MNIKLSNNIFLLYIPSKEDYQELSIGELVGKKNQELVYISRYEMGNIIEEEKYTKPSPELVYSVALQRLNIIIEIMIEKLNKTRKSN